ncbi:MAG: hypothetical protein V4726_17440 [Verrucomicrobiota bacterium]
MSLRAALRDADPAKIGFDPLRVPGPAGLVLPLELIQPQIAKGRVEIGLDDLRNGVLERYRPLFVRSMEGLRVVVPLSEIFPLLPKEAIPVVETGFEEKFAGSAAETPDMVFVTPFSERGQEENLPPPPTARTIPLLRPLAPSKEVSRPLSPLRPLPLRNPEEEKINPGGKTGMKPAEPLADEPAAVSGEEILFSSEGGAETETVIKTERGASAPLPSLPASGLPPLIQRSGILSRPPGTVVIPAKTALPGGGVMLSAGAERTLFRTSRPEPGWSPASGDGGSGAASAEDDDDDEDLGESFSAASLTAEPPVLRGCGTSPLTPFPAGVNGIGNQTGHPEGGNDRSFSAEPPGTEKIGKHPGHPAPHEVSAVASKDHGTVFPEKQASSGEPAAMTGRLEDLDFGCTGDAGQMTLRAVFGTDQYLTAQDVVDRCAGLQGLKACVLLRDPHSLSSAGMPEEEAGAFIASAGRTRESLKVLAETMGLGDDGNFTLRTDYGVRSFFPGIGLCLAVWHDQPVFLGGTREKLILVVRELSHTALS